MTKFKKGDEIECTSIGLGRIVKGEKFLVVDSRPQLSAPSFHPELVYIEVEGVVRNYSPKHFKLVARPATPEFPEGSPIKFIYEQWLTKQEGGNNVSRSDVVNVKENGDSPPETKKEFKKNYWYKCISGTTAGGITQGKYYQVENVGGRLTVTGDNGVSNLFGLDRFDVNSESPCRPIDKTVLDNLRNTVSSTIVKARPVVDNPQFYLGEWKEDINNLFKQTEEKQTMGNANRRVVNIQLLDNDSGLPVEHSLVAEFNGVVTEDSNEVTIQEIISTGEVAERIKTHNENRAKQLDLAILKTTGQKVNLLPIKLKDLTWNIK